MPPLWGQGPRQRHYLPALRPQADSPPFCLATLFTLWPAIAAFARDLPFLWPAGLKEFPELFANRSGRSSRGVGTVVRSLRRGRERHFPGVDQAACCPCRGLAALASHRHPGAVAARPGTCTRDCDAQRSCQCQRFDGAPYHDAHSGTDQHTHTSACNGDARVNRDADCRADAT